MKKTLGVAMVDKKYHLIYFVSPNIFYEYRNIKDLTPLGDVCSEALKNIVKDNLNDEKQKKLVEYYEYFLTNEEKNMLENKDNYPINLINYTIDKFSTDEGIESIKKKISKDSEANKKIAKQAHFIYTKILKSFKKDISISCSLISNLLEFILKTIKTIEGTAKNVDFNVLCNLDIIPKNILISIQNLENIKSTLNKSDNSKLNTMIQMCNNELVNILDWFILKYLKEYDFDIKNISNMGFEDLSIMTTHELIEKGWTIEDILKEAIAIDYETIIDIEEEHVGSFEQWLPIIKNHPENRQMLVDNNLNIIGYWSFVQLFDEYFKKAKNGEIIDSEIKENMLPVFIPGYIYNIYFLTICLREKYRLKLGLKKLIFAFVNMIEDLAKKDIFINEICALAYSDSGELLSKDLGLKFYKKHKDSGKIYCCKTLDLIKHPICNKFTDLRNIYQNKFK